MADLNDLTYFVSAKRTGTELGRLCRHKHPDAIEADKCAEKRAVNAIVRHAQGSATVTPAPYLRVRRKKQQVVQAAERLLINPR